MIQSKVKESGVSPVIGIILMVAVTVILVALASNVVFDLGGDVGESPEIALDADKGAGTVQVIRNGNVDNLIYNNGEGTKILDTSSDSDLSVSAGTTHDLASEGSGNSVTVTVIAVVDGEEQVVQTFEEMNLGSS